MNQNKQNNLMDDNNPEINPHMPQYIVKVPWYLSQTGNSLKHQKSQVEVTKLPINVHTEKGIIQNKSIYKFRKGACENCGSVTHKLKECCERPRQRGAKFSNNDFRPDEFIYEVPLDYEGKRDRWNGYNPDSYRSLIYEYEKFQEVKKKYKEEEVKDITDEKVIKKAMKDEDLEESGSSEDENKFLNVKNDNLPKEFKKQADRITTEEIAKDPIQNDPDINPDFREANDDEVILYLESLKQNPKAKEMTVRDIPKKILYQICTSKNLHIGDDYSKYLLNLALNSAYYDGKSRSMRENPNPQANDEFTFKGDNYILKTGDAMKLVEIESFIREANDKNRDLNLNNVCMPSQAELFYKYFKEKKGSFKSEQLKKVLAKYGGEEHLIIPDGIKENVNNDNEVYADNNNGISNRSIYPEDIFINGHSSIWGSFFNDKFGWGYKCCFSFDKNSYCKGENGKKDNLRFINEHEDTIKELSAKDKEKKRLHDEQLRIRNEKEEKNGVFNDFFERLDKFENNGYTSKKTKREEDSNTPNDSYDPKKLMKAVEKEKMRNDKDLSIVNTNLAYKKRKFDPNQLMGKDDVTVTKEDMEAYKLMKMHFDDPLKNKK